MKPAILFVCMENACRSQMAEGFARRHAEGRMEAWSAGSRPSRQIDATAILVMKEIGIDLSRQRSKGVRELPSRPWDYLVAMGGGPCPLLATPFMFHWQIPDPKYKSLEEFRKVRDQIEQKVKELLDEVQRLSPPLRQ